MRVGLRHTALDNLDSALRAAVDGTGTRTLVLQGGPGHGKTYALRSAASSLGVPTRWATGDELAWRHPFGAAEQLSAVELPTPVPADADELLLAVIDEACGAHPLLLVVDDAHHVDAATLTLLGRIADMGRDLPVVLLIARRHLPAREQLSRLLTRPEVRVMELPPMDALDLDELVRSRTGRSAGPGLLAVLARTGGNPMLAESALSALSRVGGLQLAGDDVVDADPDTTTSLTDLDAAMEAQLTLLTSESRDVVQRLAIVGSASVADLASLAGQPAAALVSSAQSAAEAGIVRIASSGYLSFVHDAYAEAAYRQIPEPLRKVLHDAAAELWQGNSTVRNHHRLASGNEQSVLDILAEAENDLANVPSVAADVLGNAIRIRGTEGDAAVALASARARALLRSGQMQRAEEVASSTLQVASDAVSVIGLQQVLALTAMSRGDARAAVHRMQPWLDKPLPATAHRLLADKIALTKIMGCTEPIPLQPLSDTPLAMSLSGLLAEALRSCLTASPRTGVEYAIYASTRHLSDGDPHNGPSADIWPPVIELFNDGPHAAAEQMQKVEELSKRREAPWQKAFHLFTAGLIDYSRGRLDDAAAQLDSGFDIAASAEMGWTSWAVGGRALIDLWRGDARAATRRLDAWESRREDLVLGAPMPARARVAILEGERHIADAARLASEVWQFAVERHCYCWLPQVAPDFARIALRADDARLLEQVRQGLDRLPRPLSPAAIPGVSLVEALMQPEVGDMIIGATRAAEAAAEIGDFMTEIVALEEAACLAASTGRKSEAHEIARRVVARTEAAAAPALRARLLSRLRSFDVRLGSRAARRRPTVGWNSLTPTERHITDLIAAGMAGPDIARSLHLAPRTVQTHVSHALAKLGVKSRVELAAAARQHTQAETRVP